MADEKGASAARRRCRGCRDRVRRPARNPGRQRDLPL